MMKNFIYLLIFLISASCSTKKNVVYLQDIKHSNIYNTQFSEYKIKTDDILKIDFRAMNEESISFLELLITYQIMLSQLNLMAIKSITQEKSICLRLVN